MNEQISKCDVCIVGAGQVGQVAALAIAREGVDVTLCAPKQQGQDLRTTALLMDSVEWLKTLGVWQGISAKAHPLKTMRIVDATDRLMRSPQADFHSSEIELEAFGYNVQNDEFGSVVAECIERDERITHLDCSVNSVTKCDQRMQVSIEDKDGVRDINAGFVVGSDGKNSLVRQNMQAGEREWQYPQTAIVLDFKHQHPTRFTSTEFHTETGPFTIVPRSNNIAGLVWMEKPENADKIANLPTHELARLLEGKMQSFLGKIEILTAAQTFPLKGLVARTFGDGNWALLGEAAHVFPPIGAQGFNLGIRDVRALVDILSRFTNTENRGAEYSKLRNVDVNLRTLGVDLLNRSLMSGFLPVHILRGLGFHALGNLGPLRKAVMRLGISPQHGTSS